MEAREKFCKDCLSLELRTFYLKTEKVSGYCAKLQKRKNGNDVCSMPGSNETLQGGNEKLQPPQKREWIASVKSTL